MSRSQTGLLVFYLLAAFIVYITLRGELPLYMGIIFGPPTPKVGTDEPQKDTKTETLDKAASAADTAVKVAKVAEIAAMVVA